MKCIYLFHGNHSKKKNFSVLPFGLTSAPYLFTKLLRPWPKRHTKWLGVNLNLKKSCLSILEYRIASLFSPLKNAINKDFVLSACEISKICGKMISMKIVIGNICSTRNF